MVAMMAQEMVMLPAVVIPVGYGTGGEKAVQGDDGNVGGNSHEFEGLGLS
jgi:hypothetical protein